MACPNKHVVRVPCRRKVLLGGASSIHACRRWVGEVFGARGRKQEIRPPTSCGGSRVRRLRQEGVGVHERQESAANIEQLVPSRTIACSWF